MGPVDAELSHTRRLARENGWSARQAARVFEEYRRFVYLAVTAAHPVTPSDAVDQAWQLHLTYTQDYRERLCPEVLGRALHHGPTRGGREAGARFFEQYAQTLRSDEAALAVALFGTAVLTGSYLSDFHRMRSGGSGGDSSGSSGCTGGGGGCGS